VVMACQVWSLADLTSEAASISISPLSLADRSVTARQVLSRAAVIVCGDHLVPIDLVTISKFEPRKIGVAVSNNPTAIK
jgi:hypothetical protein